MACLNMVNIGLYVNIRINVDHMWKRYWKTHVTIQIYVGYSLDLIQTQGGRIFEISWEPNFPVNNFARNIGKIALSSTQ